MTVTDCAIGTQSLTTQEIHATLIAQNSNEDSLVGNALGQLRTVAGLCNAGEFDAATNSLPLSQRKIHGDATDQAVLRFAEGLGPVSELKRCWHAKYDLAFNSKNKFMIRVLGLRHQDGLQDALPVDTAAIFEPADM